MLVVWKDLQNGIEARGAANGVENSPALKCYHSPVMGVAKPVVLLKARCYVASQSNSVKSSAEGTDEAVDGDEGEECAGERKSVPGPGRGHDLSLTRGVSHARCFALLLLLLLLLLPAILRLSSGCCGLVQNGMARWWCAGSPVHHPNDDTALSL